MLVSKPKEEPMELKEISKKCILYFTKTLPKLQQTRAGITPYSPRSPQVQHPTLLALLVAVGS